MDALIEKLVDFKNSVNLNQRFDFQFDFYAPFFSDMEIDKLNSTKIIFMRNILLKELIKDKVNGLIALFFIKNKEVYKGKNID